MLQFRGFVGSACCAMAVALIFPVHATAQVVTVTGVSASSNQLVVSGSGFGSHGDYGGSQGFLNAAWNDFATGINGGKPGLDGANKAGGTNETTGGPPSNKRWAEHKYKPTKPHSIARIRAAA